ncbi:MAG: ABC transporter ATP-binding protein [Alsobacter sp.]
MSATSETILSLRGVTTHFQQRSGWLRPGGLPVRAVDGIDLDVRRGEILGVVGESGCGKTTLGKTIVQLIKATSGQILYRGADGETDLVGLDDKGMQPFRRRLQIVFQDPSSSLNPSFTVFGSLEAPLRKYGMSDRDLRRRKVADLLEAVNLRQEFMDRYPGELSGGQRQRVGIARALSLDPELVVCDEAVSALDVSVQAQVLQLLLELRRDRNLTYVFITHNLSVMEYFCDRVAVMYLGRIVELCEADDLIANPRHPYTRALLSAIPVPVPGQRTQRLQLRGEPPHAADPPTGCAFHPRCSRQTDLCRTSAPDLQRVATRSGDHWTACHFPENANSNPEQ